MIILNDDGVTERRLLSKCHLSMQYADNLMYTLVMFLYMLRWEIEVSYKHSSTVAPPGGVWCE